MSIVDSMDIPSTRDKTNYWSHQQDVNQSTKSHLKVYLYLYNSFFIIIHF
jgi:hypothetical protein